MTGCCGIEVADSHAVQALRKALDFLRRPDIASLPDGRVDIDGDQVYALPQRYATILTDPPRFEHHRRYIDIQFIVTGDEVIGWAPAERMQVTEAYDPAKDIAFGTVPAGQVTVTLKNPELKAVRSERVRVPPGGEAVLKVDLLEGQR